MTDVNPASCEGQQPPVESPPAIVKKSKSPRDIIPPTDQPRFGTPRPPQDQVYIVCRTQYPTQPPLPDIVQQVLLHPQVVNPAQHGNGIDYPLTFHQMQSMWTTIEWAGPNLFRAREQLLQVIDDWSSDPTNPVSVRNGPDLCMMYRNAGWGKRELIGKAWVAGPFPISRAEGVFTLSLCASKPSRFALASLVDIKERRNKCLLCGPPFQSHNARRIDKS
jgi:hypothetical protein